MGFHNMILELYTSKITKSTSILGDPKTTGSPIESGFLPFETCAKNHKVQVVAY